jgi:hypothetical protein
VVALNERIRRLNRTLGMVRVKKQPANAPGKAPAIWPSCSEIDTHTSLKTFGISERKDQRPTPAPQRLRAAQTTPAESAPETAQPRCLPASSRPQTELMPQWGAVNEAVVNVRMSSLTVVNASASAGLVHPDAGLRNLQVDQACDGSGHLLRMLHLQHALRPALQAAGDHFVVVAVADHHHPRFQPLDFSRSMPA